MALILILFCIIPGIRTKISAQNPPAEPQTESVTLRGGTFHIGNGTVLHDGHLLFEDGIISYIGTEAQVADRIIDVSGHHIYPGLIGINTPLGLSEIDAVRATADYREVGEYNPHVRALIAYNTDSEIIPTVRSNGILLAETAPQGGVISGLSAVVRLDAWNWEDAAVRDSAALHLTWPSPYRFDRSTQSFSGNKEYEKQIRELEIFFEEAAAYSSLDTVQTNLRFRALKPVLQRKTTLFIHADDEKAILDVLDFGDKTGLSIALVGAADSWKLAGELAKRKIPVILAPTQRLPRRPDTDIDQPFKTPRILQEAGVLWCFSQSGNWEQRNLPFQGGQAVGYGLAPESAVQGLTLNTAKILGINHQYGSLETGKSATLVICDGDILDPMSSIVLQAFIDGREVDPDTRQKALYRKFGKKYKILK